MSVDSDLNAGGVDARDDKELGKAPCIVCGGRWFVPGPSGRLYKGLAPTCATCGSLERHRIYREILQNLIGGGEAKDLVALQFSRDPSIDRSWFRKLDHSIYGHTNSLDIQQIALPDGAYDIVICNHVLEHVPDDVAAVRELTRIVSHRGFLFLTVPVPAERATTSDWGKPNPAQSEHYRVYGYDFVERLATLAPASWIALVRGADPVTGRQDMAFILSSTRAWHDKPIKAGLRAKSVHRP